MSSVAVEQRQSFLLATQVLDKRLRLNSRNLKFVLYIFDPSGGTS